MKIIIHRGIVTNKVYENTYFAIKRALKDRESFGVEFDVRLTKDNKIVLSHNSIIEGNVIEHSTYREIISKKYLDTLDKILTINTKKLLLIDIKTSKNYKVFADILLKELKDEKKKIYLTSFDRKIINYLRPKTSFKTGITYTYYRKNDYDFVSINHNFITKDRLKNIKNREIFLWTIDSDKERQKIERLFNGEDNLYLIMDKKE